MNVWEYLLLATGFMGHWTVLFVARQLKGLVMAPPSINDFHSPKGGCTDAVVAELHRAKKEILVQAYSFTSKPIAQALVDAKGRGVHVEILLDKSNQSEVYSELREFIDQGLTPLIDSEHAIAHNKVMIVDGKTLLTGSFNFTHQAEAENAENLLVIKGHPALVKAYRQTFLNHKAHSQAPNLKAVATAVVHQTSQRRAA